MRILIVYPSAASSVLFAPLVRGCVDAGHQVGVAMDAQDSSLPSLADLPAEATVFHVPMPRGMNPRSHLRAARDMRRVVRTFAPDVVHAQISAAVFTTALARDWTARTIGCFHGLSYPLRPAGYMRTLLRAAELFAARRLDVVQVVNRADHAEMSRQRVRGRIDFLPIGAGCDVERFVERRAREPVRLAARAELGLAPENVVAVFVGRWTDFKGFGRAVQAFRRAAADVPQLRLVLLGGVDPMHPTGLSSEEERELDSDPRILKVSYSRDVPRLLAASDFLLFPSEREGCSTCIMEALASGIPVITTDARGCGDLVDHGRTGLVVRQGDAEALVTAIRRLAASPEMLDELGRGAAEERQRVDRATYVADMLRVYAEPPATASGHRVPASSGRA